MVEPWTALGVSILKDLVLKEILLKLGKEALEDYVEDFFKDCIKEDVQLAHPADRYKFLCDRAVNAPYPLAGEENKTPNPRQITLAIIIKEYPNHPQTLPLLHDRAENDPDEKVREFVKNKLAELEE